MISKPKGVFRYEIHISYIKTIFTNVYAAIPIGHSITLKENYNAIKDLLQHINNNGHQ